MSPEPDIAVSLQPLSAVIYARSHYERDMHYREPLQPPLTAADAAWLEDRLRPSQA